MIFTKTEISDVFVVEPKVYGDDRGYFLESFRQDKFNDYLGREINFIQDNESKSTYGVLRGLHFQRAPYAQSKLVRVIEGEVLDVAVDIRKKSPTFGKHVAVRLSGENKKQLFIPQGFAHGFIVLSETCTFCYKVDNYYNAESDGGVLYNDSELNIEWGMDLSKIKISEKDKKLPKLLDARV